MLASGSVVLVWKYIFRVAKWTSKMGGNYAATSFSVNLQG